MASALMAGGLVVAGPSALASATAQHLPAASLPPEVLSPTTGLATVNGCPDALVSDWGVLMMNSGNAVMHDSTNKNGDWGGDTVEGIGTITLYTTAPDNPDDPSSMPSDPDTNFGPFTGHVTQWGGGGNNSKGQGEGGFTFSFHGVSESGMTVDVQLHAHQTFSAANGGTPTANTGGGTMTCS